MKIKNWFLLLLVYASYLCLGGFAFNKIECPHSIQIRRQEWLKQENMTADLKHFKENLDDQDLKDEFDDLLKKYLDFREFPEFDEKCQKWSFYHSLFFAFTAVTTIGYGHQAPDTNDGRIFCVFYSLLGIPLNAILIGAMGNLFSQKMLNLKERAMSDSSKGTRGLSRISKVVLEGFVLLFFLSLVFLFIPAAVFSSTEDESWGYVDSVYYTFITLSTVGFGDMVAGRNDDVSVMENNVSKVLYQIGIIVWIVLGLGYIVGVINVLIQALQATSKPVKRVFQGIKNQIHVQDYWRRILTELIHIKESEGWMQEDLLEDGGGGSEPNLGHLDIPSVDIDKRRAVSTGDLSKEDCRNSILNPQNKYESKQQSLQELDKDSEMLADIQELNEDTITSLRHFLTTSKMAGGHIPVHKPDNNFTSWLANNVPDAGMSLPPTRPVSRANSASYTNTVQPGMRTQRFQSVHNPQKFRRRSIVVSRQNSVTSQHSLPIPGPAGLLENTSLAEFLTAVEKVRQKSEAELQAVTTTSDSRKPSVLRKLSMRMSGSGGRRAGDRFTQSLKENSQPSGGPLSLNQVTNLLAQQIKRDSTASQTSNNPLVRSASQRSNDTERSLIAPNSPTKIQNSISMPGLLATESNAYHTFNGMGNSLQVQQHQQGNTIGNNQVYPTSNASGNQFLHPQSANTSNQNYRNLDDVFVVSPVQVEPGDHDRGGSGDDSRGGRTDEMLIINPNTLEAGQVVHRNMTANQVPARKVFTSSNYNTK